MYNRYVRHPSYSGYYIWSLGTQLLLGNSICLIVYTIVLYQFFAERIEVEESRLLEFFPEYAAYRQSCHAGIPFLAWHKKLTSDWSVGQAKRL